MVDGWQQCMYPEHRYPTIQKQKYKQTMSQCYVVMLYYIHVLHVLLFTLNVTSYKQVLYNVTVTELKSKYNSCQIHDMT